MHPNSLTNIFSLLLLLVLLPFGSSLSFDFPSFNKSAPSLLNLGADASWNQAIHLTRYGPVGRGSSSGRAVYPQPLLLWDPATRTLTDFITHFSFRIAVDHVNTCPCSGLAFFLAPYPYTPPDVSSGGFLGLFSKATARDASKNQVVAAEFGTHRNTSDPSSCHVGIDVNSIDSPRSVDCKGGITSGRATDATVSYSSSSRTLTVVVVHEDADPSLVETVSISHVVDLRDVLPSEVAVGFSAATANPATERHEVLSWDFSSTLQSPTAAAAAAASDQPMSGSVADKVSGKLTELTGLVGANLAAVTAAIGTGALALGYKLTKKIRRRRDERDGQGRCRCRCRCGPDEGSIETPGDSPPPHHSKALDPSVKKGVLIHAVKLAVREELRSRFSSTSPAVTHSRRGGRAAGKHSHPPPRSGPPLAEPETWHEDNQLEGAIDVEGKPTEAVVDIPEDNPGDENSAPSPGDSPPPLHSQAPDPSLKKEVLIHAVKAAVREELQSRFSSTTPAVTHSRRGGRAAGKRSDPPPRSGAPMADPEPWQEDNQEGAIDDEGKPTEAVVDIPEDNPGDENSAPSTWDSPPPHHSHALDPSLKNEVLIHAVKAAVREEFQSRFSSTTPAVAHSRRGGRAAGKRSHPPPRSGAPLAEPEPWQENEEGALDDEGPEHNPGDHSIYFGEAPGLTDPKKRQDRRGARIRKSTERVVRKGMFDWIHRKLFRSDNLGGCL